MKRGKSGMWAIFTVLVAFISATIIIIAVYSLYIRPKRQSSIVCAIMITGKDAERIQYARKSVANFNEQSYTQKQLIIINHHPTERVLDQGTKRPPNVFEFHVAKTSSMSLGQLRNVALQMVPLNALWTTWDDDDYRHPMYIQMLVSHMPPSHNTVVSITQRLEYNKNNGFSWHVRKADGMVLFLASLDNRVAYLDMPTLEDIHILDSYKTNGYKLKLIDNNPNMYVRLVHTTNTSTYVEPQRAHLRKGVNYFERHTSPTEKQYINSILPKLLLQQ